ncbi:MAG TPA: VOC family protein [Ignavibacteriaceae bacterium]
MPIDWPNKIDMTQINAYITFSGNCREAMNFYREVLDGELTLQTIGESPMAEKLPANMRAYILHAELKKGDLTLMASDMVSDQGLVKGNSITLMLACNSEEEIKNCYKKLSAGGKATHPLEDTFWGALFGGLTDKFGNHWLLNFAKNGAN